MSRRASKTLLMSKVFFYPQGLHSYPVSQTRRKSKSGVLGMVIILTLRWLRQETLEVHCEMLSPFKEIKNKTVRRKERGWRERE